MFYPYSEYLKRTFGGKTYKIVVASGLTCPTRDGAIAKAGCAFCDVRGSSSFHGKKGRGLEVVDQIKMRIGGIAERFKPDAFLAYFQSYTNTYSDVETLRELYEAALSVPEIKGLNIGTRPDCLSDDVCLLLEEFGRRTVVSLELGVQSLHDPSLEWLARGHDARCSLEALERLARLAPSVHVGVHLMFGQPTDPVDVARTTARALNDFPIKSVKLHQLMVLEHTELADRFRAQPFALMDLDEYTGVIAEFLEHLRPDIAIERLYASATHPEECLGPAWSCERWRPHNRMRELFEQWGTIQGSALASSEALVSEHRALL